MLLLLFICGSLALQVRGLHQDKKELSGQNTVLQATVKQKVLDLKNLNALVLKNKQKMAKRDSEHEALHKLLQVYPDEGCLDKPVPDDIKRMFKQESSGYGSERSPNLPPIDQT